MRVALEEREGKGDTESVAELTSVAGMVCVRETWGDIEEEGDGMGERVMEGDRESVREEWGEGVAEALPEMLLVTE